MKSIRIGLIVILAAVTVGLGGMLVYGMSGGNVYGNPGHRNNDHVQLVLEEEIPLGGIDSISILYGMNSNDLFFYESENEAVTIREYSSTELAENELSTIKVNGSGIEIRGAARGNGGGFFLFRFGVSINERHYTEVYLPKSYCGEILAETSSGDIRSDFDFSLEKDFSAVSSSGDVNLLSVTAANASIETSSGYIKMENIDTDINGSVGEISIRTSSGDVNLQELTGETSIESSSGSLNVEAIAGNVQLKSSSGDITVKEIAGETKTESSSGYQTIETLTGDAQLISTSGDVNIRHADGAIQVMTTSGYVKVLEGSGDRKISTSSGDVIAEGTEGNFQVSSQSGSVQLNMQKGEGRIETSSGDIRLRMEELAGTLDINSNSGYVNAALSTDNEFEFEADTISGDIMTFFDSELKFSSKGNHAQGTCGTNAGGNQVLIQTTSGDIKISKF